MSKNTHPYSGDTPIPKVADFLREQRERFPDPQSRPAPEQPQYKQGGEEGEGSSGGKTKKTDAHPSAHDQTKALKKGQGSKDGNRRTVKDPTTGNEVVIEDVNADFKKAAENPELVVPKTAMPGQLEVVTVGFVAVIVRRGMC